MAKRDPEAEAARATGGETMLTKGDLRALASRVRGPRYYRVARESLTADTYGKRWCLTDILSLEEEARGPLLCALTALDTKGRPDPEKALRMDVKIRSVSGEPVTLARTWPEEEAPPNMTDDEGIGHHRPIQWERQEHVIPAESTCRFVDTRWQESAVWLLTRFGWKAREGGLDRRRYIDRQRKAGDQWLFVEEAFAALHPKDAPPGMKIGRGEASAAA